MIDQTTEIALTEKQERKDLFSLNREEAELLTDQQVRDTALVWLNSIRTEYNLEPLEKLPRGIPGASNACVGSKALIGVNDYSCTIPVGPRRRGTGYGHTKFAHEGQVISIPLPAVFREFAVRFDAGKFPDLIL